MIKNKKPVVISVLIAIVLIVIAVVYVREHKYEFRAETESNLFTLAQISANKGDHEKAVKYYEKLLAKDPKHTVAMAMMADSYAKLKIPEQAFKALDKAIELDPSEQNFANAINIAVRLNDTERAKKYREMLAEKSKPAKK